ncbi:hypothetical protein Pcinc_017597 [Petrolisthes cinctipes]|uniref:RBR-type E3 ubiquitin transferase n=1 Tax=Petrolisthes cinctipes TaxID=88211 RepID=A0AAE1FNY6_PETCI|nr:hypothetical protein Pcinc_017597 [Petrolisthes cinctipes]
MSEPSGQGGGAVAGGGGVRTRSHPPLAPPTERGGMGMLGGGNNTSSTSSSSSSSSGFPRMSLRSLLLNSPFSLRSRPKRVRTPSSSYKLTIEPDSNTDSSAAVFSESGSGGGEASASGATGWSSIRRHHHSGRSLVSSRRGSVGSRGTARGDSCSSSDGGACATSLPSSNTTLPGVGVALGTTRDAGSTSSETSTSEGHSGGRRECSLCLQDVSDDLFPTLLSCPHSACLSCLRQYLKVEITESRVNISCPQCNELMHPTDIHTILNNALLSYKFEDFMLRRVLSMDPDTRWCPAPDCGYAVVATGCAGCPKLKCERPGCGSHFCYHCKAEWHPNQTCDMARAMRSPNGLHTYSYPFTFIHDIQTSEDVKACPRCQVLIVKMDDGSCNHMTCSVCGAEFCWLCMKEISDLHYLSPSGCTFWGKKPWSRKKKILWQLGTLVGAPLGIGLVAGLAVPAMIIGIPIWVGRKLHARYSRSNPHRRNLAVVGGVTASAVISPVLAGLAVSIGVPILLAYVYGVVPISLCRSGGCGVTTSAAGVRIAFDDENDMVFGIPGRQSESSHAGGVGLGSAGLSGAGAGPSGAGGSIGEGWCGASLSSTHNHLESDRESASNTAIAPASLTGSIASSCISRTNRLEVHVDIAHGSRSTASGETASLAISTHTLDTENASVRGLAGSLLQYKVCESEGEGGAGGDSASGVLEAGAGLSQPHVTNLYLHGGAGGQGGPGGDGWAYGPGGTGQYGEDLRLDSVSAIITAHQFSRKGVTFTPTGQEGGDGSGGGHVTLTLDDDSPFEDEDGGQGGSGYRKPRSRSLLTRPTLPMVHVGGRRASSADGATKEFDRPARCESFPRLE